MRKGTLLVLALAIILTTVTGCSKGDETAGDQEVNITPIQSAGFIHVEDGMVVDETGAPILLMGIAFGNDVWGLPKMPVYTDHTEESYKEIKDMGFNCVRFYMNYQLFEDDNNPYVYKQSGFDWINDNIAWAKKYGIKLILNMHVPQGGYQSQGNGTALWTDEENQKRLAALWKKFAEDYADEETIIGYGIINEPIVPELDTVEASIKQCQDLMQKLTDVIREVDKNHIIFAERVCALKNMQTGESNWNLNVADTQFLLNDSNTVYEFHTYEPHSFTHQDLDWAGTKGVIKVYPSDEITACNILNYWVGCKEAKEKEILEDGWSLYESDFVQKTDKYNLGSIALRADNTGVGGLVLFDDVVLEEYKDGILTNTLQELGFDEDANGFYFWAANGTGTTYYSSDQGYSSSGCLVVADTTSDANVTGYRFALKEGYEYRVRAKVKKIGTSAIAMPRIDFSLADKLGTLNAEYLEDSMEMALEFGIKNNVPMYLGEFGATTKTFTQNRGGAQWVKDMLEICIKHNVHFTYHTYHEVTFGLYMNTAYSLPSQKNEQLEEVFEEMLK